MYLIITFLGFVAADVVRKFSVILKVRMVLVGALSSPKIRRKRGLEDSVLLVNRARATVTAKWVVMCLTEKMSSAVVLVPARDLSFPKGYAPVCPISVRTVAALTTPFIFLHLFSFFFKFLFNFFFY